MKTVTVNRDPFARCEVVRRVIRVDVECAGCARRARFQYGTEADGIWTRVSWSPVLVCSIQCFRGLTD